MDLLAPGPLLLLLVAVVVLVAGGGWRGLELLRRRRAFVAPGPGLRDGAAHVPGPTDRPPLLLQTEPVPRGLERLVPAVPVPGSQDGEDAGRVRAHFVVVGTRSCSDCARTLALLRAETADQPAVAVTHVLAEDAPGLVARFRVRTAPTVLLVDATGRVAGVHPGAVDSEVVRAALRDLDSGGRPFAGAAAEPAPVDAAGAR